MLDSALRPVVDRAARPLASLLAGRVHPHLVTGVGLALGLMCAIAVWQRAYPAALVFWIANRMLDALDGAVARDSRMQSDFGGYLDLLADFTLYATIPIAAVLGLPSGVGEGPLIALACLLGSFYINAASWLYLSALLEKRRCGPERFTSISMPPGVIEGAETILFFSLMIVLPAYTEALMWVMAGLVLITAVQRPVWAIRNLNPQ